MHRAGSRHAQGAWAAALVSTSLAVVFGPAHPHLMPIVINGSANAGTVQQSSLTRTPPSGSTVPHYSYQIVRRLPHDSGSFTQGLEIEGDVLYEGTGLEGHSRLRRLNIETGRLLQEVPLSPDLFGEGITVWRDRVVQLTWRSQIGFVYDARTLRLLRTFKYEGEGWGLTHSARELLMSDGSAHIRFLDPETLSERRRLLVTDRGVPIDRLNELEWVEGEVFANVWQTDWIARISPESGQVVGWIDLSGLLSPAERARTDVLNGIAYDAQHHRLFVTGKLWPALFEIRLIRR